MKIRKLNNVCFEYTYFGNPEKDGFKTEFKQNIQQCINQYNITEYNDLIYYIDAVIPFKHSGSYSYYDESLKATVTTFYAYDETYNEQLKTTVKNCIVTESDYIQFCLNSKKAQVKNDSILTLLNKIKANPNKTYIDFIKIYEKYSQENNVIIKFADIESKPKDIDTYCFAKKIWNDYNKNLLNLLVEEKDFFKEYINSFKIKNV